MTRSKYTPDVQDLGIDRLQFYAAVSFERRQRGLANNPRLARHFLNLAPWMIQESLERDFGIRDHRNNVRRPAVDLHALDPHRGNVPSLCPEGSPCNRCRTNPATVRVGSTQVFGFEFVCDDCVEFAFRRAKRGY